MGRVRSTGTTQRTGPARSPRAAQAHDAGDVTWIVDLSQPPPMVVEQRVQARRTTTVTVLSCLGVAVWVGDLLMVRLLG